MEISENGLKLLMFFREKNYGLAVYAVPAEQRDWFGGDSVACEQAQAELANADLLDLSRPPPIHVPSGVRAAALTRKGVRYLQAFDQPAV